MSIELERICEIVRECGNLIKNADRSSLGIDSKQGRANFVTKYDKKVELILKDCLLKVIPDALFIGEEGEAQVFNSKDKLVKVLCHRI